MKKRTIRLILFLCSAAALLISARLFWNMGIYVDMAGTSPAVVSGGGFWMAMDWLRLFLLLAMTVLTGAELWKEDKKWILATAAIAGILYVTAVIVHWKQKAAMSVSIIGGADGPTAVFLAGKVPSRWGITAAAAGIVLLLLIVWLILRIRKKQNDEDN